MQPVRYPGNRLIPASKKKQKQTHLNTQPNQRSQQTPQKVRACADTFLRGAHLRKTYTTPSPLLPKEYKASPSRMWSPWNPRGGGRLKLEGESTPPRRSFLVHTSHVPLVRGHRTRTKNITARTKKILNSSKKKKKKKISSATGQAIGGANSDQPERVHLFVLCCVYSSARLGNDRAVLARLCVSQWIPHGLQLVVDSLHQRDLVDSSSQGRRPCQQQR